MDAIKGFMYDVADGMKGDADYIERMMVRLSGYGYNMLMLYLEHCFQFPSCPALGTNESLGPEDIRRLDAVAEKLGMELVPCVNIAGHSEGFGFMEAYKTLCADPTGTSRAVGQLRVDLPESLEFLERLYADIFACFRSKYVHIGADEIGLERQMPHLSESAKWDKAMDRIVHMIDLVKRNGKTPMLWGDMLLKHRETIHRIADDAILCDWAYYSDPLFKGVSNVESQRFFRDAGKKTVAFPGINHFYGNPVVSVNSTMNISGFYKDHHEVFGPKAQGAILCVWGTEAGTFFSSSWPWIYLQSKLFAGESHDGMDFMREYTRLEWGVDTDGLAEWYDLVDVQVQKTLLFQSLVDEQVRKAIEPMRNRPYKLLRLFVRDVFRTENPLPLLYDVRSWLTPQVKREMRPLLDRALAVAEELHDRATARKEEPRLLLEWTRMMRHMLELTDDLEQAAEHYNAAAKTQGVRPDEHAASKAACVASFRRMEQTFAALIRWSELAIECDDGADYDCWWLREGREHIRRRADELETGRSGRRGLVNFEVFLRIHPSLPFASRRWKETARSPL